MLDNKKILLIVTGGIAAYKAIDLASKLKKMGAIVKTILTKSATEFISQLNFSAITGETSYCSQFDLADPIAHITLADWADIMVIAPATANFIGKIANGIGDDLASSTFLAFHKPVLVIPAMNVNMYQNQAVQCNINTLQKRNVKVMLPDKGMLACGYVGRGKYPANEEIIPAIITYLQYNNDLSAKFLITAGASQEIIDPMRFITNYSSGKMGLALARAVYLRGGQVELINSKLTYPIPYYLENSWERLSAQDMFEQVVKDYQQAEVIIMTAAVADYTIDKPHLQKIKKSGDLTLNLTRTQDILHYLGKHKKSNQILVGFSAESENLLENAQQKLVKKNLDLIIANNIQVSQSDDTSALLITKNSYEEYQGSKFALAHKIVDTIEDLRKMVEKNN